jgi:hypothetical protein
MYPLIFGVIFIQASPDELHYETRYRASRPTVGWAVFAERPAAATRHAVIATPKAIGMMKKYIPLNTVTTAKQPARAHAVKRMSVGSCAERLPSCQASIAASNRNTVTKRPNPT